MSDQDLFILFCAKKRAQESGLDLFTLGRALLQLTDEELEEAAEADREARAAQGGFHG